VQRREKGNDHSIFAEGSVLLLTALQLKAGVPNLGYL